MSLREVYNYPMDLVENDLVSQVDNFSSMSTDLTSISGDDLLGSHTSLRGATRLKNPYWEAARGYEKFFTKDQRHGFEIITCRFADLAPDQAACFVENAYEQYLFQGTKEKKGTMGDFPEDPDEKERLKKAFMEDFDPNMGVVVVQKEVQDASGFKYKAIVGGLLLIPGKGDRRLGDVANKSNSTISTLKSLNFDLPTFLANLREDQAFCVSRLFSISPKQAEELGISKMEKAYILPELIAGINNARIGLEKVLRRKFDFGIADISNFRLLDFVGRYGWELITDKTKPSEWVEGTVLHWHYDYYTDEKNDRRVYAIYASRENMDLKCKNQLASLREKV